MRLEQLSQIIEIEKQRSISKAAKALFMAQSSLSGSLNSLEDEIGVRLFERNTGGVTPTAEGREVLQLARQVLENCDLILSFGQKNRQLHGDVKLCITQAYGYMYSDIVVEFKSRFPQARLILQTESQNNVVEALSQGKSNIDLTMWGFTDDQTEQVLKNAGLKYERFQSHQLMIFMSQDNRFAENDSVTLSEMQTEQFISYSSSYWAQINGKLHSAQEPLMMTDRDALKRMISSGQGVAVLPETFALRDLYCEQGKIKMIPIKGTENFGKADDYLLYPAKRQLTLLEKKTLEMLREILNESILE